MAKMKRIKAETLIKRGAEVVQPLDYHYARAKASGAMWEGNMVLRKGKYTYNFKLWHHGGDTMDPSEAMDALVLEGIKEEGSTSGPFKDGYYDLFWHSVQSPGTLWVHPQGWFSNKELEKRVFSRPTFGKLGDEGFRGPVEPRNYNWQDSEDFSGDQKKKLKELGFKELPIEDD